MIYKKTKKLRAVQILLGYTKLESTVRYLSIEVDDALDLAEQFDLSDGLFDFLKVLPSKLHPRTQAL